MLSSQSVSADVEEWLSAVSSRQSAVGKDASVTERRFVLPMVPIAILSRWFPIADSR
ncbi:hypothetical protein J4G07_22520 [Candidatus Poribacteria bacterium]|nr:hypothetical protein [Candidatus Poribacteria bacterium]